MTSSLFKSVCFGPEKGRAYAVTSRGQEELGGASTALTAAEIELLVRLDGALTLGEIKSGMPALSQDEFTRAFRTLLNRRLVVAAESDPFEEQLQSHLSAFSESLGGEEADAGLLSLRRKGYFVGIARERAKAAARSPGMPLVAVVIEDEPVLAKFVQSYLAFEGIQARLAANRAEVSAQLSKPQVPDVVLLDVMLPDADGFDILRRIRKHRALREVPVIMLTGMATRGDVIRGMQGGADGYVTKPFEAEALMRALRTVLGLAAPPAKSADPWKNADSKAPRAERQPA
jgi:two-component system OmpR family response regulator